jgi:hypothetical protein
VQPRSRVRAARVAGPLLVAGGLVLGGCSDGGASGAAPTTTPPPSAASSSPSGDTSAVSCSITSCSLRLAPGTTVDVLGNRVSLGGVQDGRASLGVGDRSVSCTQGQEVSAGPLTLTCTTVTADEVVLSAGLG